MKSYAMMILLNIAANNYDLLTLWDIIKLICGDFLQVYQNLKI
jgi:hypothetical protein